MRCVVSRNTPLAAQLELPRGLPALLVVKHGVVLGKAHISQFGDSTDIWDEEVRNAHLVESCSLSANGNLWQLA